MPSINNIPSICSTCKQQGYGSRASGIKNSKLGFVTEEDQKFRHVT